MTLRRSLFFAAATLTTLALTSCTAELGGDTDKPAPQGIRTDGPAPSAESLGPGWRDSTRGLGLADLVLCKKKVWPAPADSGVSNHHYVAPTGETVTLVYGTFDQDPTSTVDTRTTGCSVTGGPDGQTSLTHPAWIDQIHTEVPKIAYTTTTSKGLAGAFLSSRTVVGNPVDPEKVEGLWAVAVVDVATDSDGTQVAEFSRRVLEAAVGSKRGEHVNPIPAVELIALPSSWDQPGQEGGGIVDEEAIPPPSSAPLPPEMLRD